MANGLNKEGIVALLKAGADPNYIDPANGMSPMLLAAKGNDLELLRLLLDHGGNPNLRNRDDDLVTFLAALQHRWDNIRLMLDRGADINAHTSNDQTLVQLVADLDQWDQVPWLIEKGANVNAVDGTGGTLANSIAMSRLTESSPQYPSLQKVHKMLIARGVQFPPLTPAQNRASRIRGQKYSP
jgi:ankyrin repeat protein